MRWAEDALEKLCTGPLGKRGIEETLCAGNSIKMSAAFDGHQHP